MYIVPSIMKAFVVRIQLVFQLKNRKAHQNDSSHERMELFLPFTRFKGKENHSSSKMLVSVVCVRACLVAQSRPTLCNPLDCSPPGSSAHGTLQARILEWVAISFSRGSS